MVTEKHSILIVEDDAEIRRLLEGILSRNGFVAAGAESAELAFKRMATFKPTLIILDFQLPGIDGLEFCRKVRQDENTKSIPIILLSAHNSEVYKITALESGADDFVAKPFSHGELIARVRAVLRRYSKHQSQDTESFFRDDGFININSESREVRINGKLATLSPREFEMLEFLLKSEGKVLSRDTISAKVWGQENLSTSRTIDVHIARLRKKMGKFGTSIQTVGKIGYKYTCPVNKRKNLDSPTSDENNPPTK